MANVIIHGGAFNTALGDFHIHCKDSGLDTLLRLGVSLGAIHDSAERYPPPNCHPDTRKAVRQIILDWIYAESSASSFFWLYGPAGAGKTAILQAIAEFLCSPSGSGQNFGGSFFFSRGKKGCDQGHFLFSTIAYQLALKVPGLHQHVNRIMESNPTLHTKSMNVQLQTLIVNAFQYLSPPPQRSYLVIIDGLDECHDKTTQQMILRLLCETITVHKLPLRLLIGSRPESHIRDSFDQESLYTVTRRVVLDETFNPGRDIRVFLQDGFAKICAENPILTHVEQPWPEEGIIDLLIQRSSGQFVYPATVLKFVGAEFCSPTRQLALAMKPDPTAFSDLDQLYTQILSVYPSTVNIVQVLGIVSASSGDFAEVFENIFGMEEGELKLVLRGLSSLVRHKNGKQKKYVIPDFTHVSFGDYLFDSSRSGPFHVNQDEYNTQFTTRSFALIMQSIRSWKMSSITRILHTTTWDYFSSDLSEAFCRSPKVVKEAIMTDIDDLIEEFRRTSSDVGAPFFAMRRLLVILQDILEFDLKKPVNLGSKYHSLQSDGIRAKFEMLLDGYGKMFDRSFCKSKDLGDMLRFLPGVAIQMRLSIQGMADLYRIEPDLLERLIKSISTTSLSRHLDFSSPYKLEDYLSCLLQDPDRSQLYYCDPMLQHISICRHILSLLNRSNDFKFEPRDLSDYVCLHFDDHLYAATEIFLHARNITDHQPAVVFFHDLETTAYYVQENTSEYYYIMRRHIIQVILRWLSMLNSYLKGVAVSVINVDFMERVCHLTNKIYREMLCIKRHDRMRYIAMDFGGLSHYEVSTFSSSPQYSLGIVLSLDLLPCVSVEDRILCSFTDFITTPELSGPLYISPDIYHTQITEYSLETISQPGIPLSQNVSLSPDWCFREHLSHALPTERVFGLLRSTRSECLIRHYCPKSMLDILEVIIKWLQGLGSERPSDLYDRFQGELLQHKKKFPQLLNLEV